MGKKNNPGCNCCHGVPCGTCADSPTFNFPGTITEHNGIVLPITLHYIGPGFMRNGHGPYFWSQGAAPTFNPILYGATAEQGGKCFRGGDVCEPCDMGGAPVSLSLLCPDEEGNWRLDQDWRTCADGTGYTISGPGTGYERATAAASQPNCRPINLDFAFGSGPIRRVVVTE